MADISPGTPEISALIQFQRGSANTASLNSLRQFRATTNSGVPADATEARQQQEVAEREKARDAANKFEALLIHNMLKSMRKTTMSENTSNQKAMYDDMLDKQMADTMVEAGGLGVARQLMSQLHGQNPDNETSSPAVNTNAKLRALLDKQQPDARTASTPRGLASADITRLRLASELWNSAPSVRALSPQQQFLEPLKPYAQQSAQRLGTTTNAVLAVAALETGWGKSMLKDELGQSTHNYFGIKANKSDTQYTRNMTTEYVQGKAQSVQARFKSYEDPADGMNGFADFILENPRYSDALKHAGNPERFLAEIHKAGYATDPDYANKAISILNQIDGQKPQL